jgi:hypothetical protein
MTPIWIFPAYPLLLIGPLAANLIDALPDSAAAARINSVAIALGAVCIQGNGFLLSLMIYSAFIYRLMTQKLPREPTRPGMVRPSLSSSTALTNLSVRLRWTEWIHSRRSGPPRKHSHAKDNAKWIYGPRRRSILFQNHFRSSWIVDVGVMSLVLHR